MLLVKGNKTQDTFSFLLSRIALQRSESAWTWVIKILSVLYRDVVQCEKNAQLMYCTLDSVAFHFIPKLLGQADVWLEPAHYVFGNIYWRYMTCIFNTDGVDELVDKHHLTSGYVYTLCLLHHMVSRCCELYSVPGRMFQTSSLWTRIGFSAK